MKNGIYNQVEAKLIGMIRDGAVTPGQRLPSERTLSVQFKVSRNTVREAIRALVEKGIIFCRRGAGSYVTQDAAERIAGQIKKAVQEKQSRLAEIFEVRKILEPAVAARAAQTIASKDLDQLGRILEEQKTALAQGGNPVESDKKFHDFLVRSTGNSVLVSLFQALNDSLAESRHLQPPERVLHSIDSHTQILAALNQGNSQAAFQAMAEHMAGIENLINPKIKE